MLPELLASFGDLDYDVVEWFWLTKKAGIVRSGQVLTMRRWLEANPDDDLAKDVRAKLTLEPKRYAAYTREYLDGRVRADAR